LKNPKNILICPLDWGIGHATRCVPIIKELIKIGHKPIIAANNRPLEFLKNEFPELAFVKFEGYSPKYPRHGSMVIKMLLSIPKILKGIKNEHEKLKELIQKHNIHIVISDNRYGLWNKNVKTIFITHQGMIKTPFYIKFLEPLLSFLIKKQIRKFTECWIPDFPEGDTLSGDLSHKHPLKRNVHFIGPLSRFRDYEIRDSETSEIYDLFVVLSGPEPQRSILEEIIFTQLKESSYKAIIVQGITEKSESFDLNERVKVFSHLDTKEMLEYFIKSNIIICRSGYSSIMDLVTLSKKAILIPTPGQTEQEYLARYLMKSKLFYFMKQNKFLIEETLDESKDYRLTIINPVKNILAEMINGL